MKYRDVINYFKGIADNHILINYFQYGDYGKILGDERQKISYPCLWVESPEMKFRGDKDNHWRVWNIAFVILMESNPNAVTVPDKYEQNIDTTEQIVYDILSKMMLDYPRMDMTSISIDIIYSKNSDHDQGWRVELDLPVKSSFVCVNPIP
jgi:hypothetical protein